MTHRSSSLRAQGSAEAPRKVAPTEDVTVGLTPGQSLGLQLSGANVLEGAVAGSNADAAGLGRTGRFAGWTVLRVNGVDLPRDPRTGEGWACPNVDALAKDTTPASSSGAAPTVALTLRRPRKTRASLPAATEAAAAPTRAPLPKTAARSSSARVAPSAAGAPRGVPLRAIGSARSTGSVRSVTSSTGGHGKRQQAGGGVGVGPLLPAAAKEKTKAKPKAKAAAAAKGKVETRRVSRPFAQGSAASPRVRGGGGGGGGSSPPVTSEPKHRRRNSDPLSFLRTSAPPLDGAAHKRRRGSGGGGDSSGSIPSLSSSLRATGSTTPRQAAAAAAAAARNQRSKSAERPPPPSLLSRRGSVGGGGHPPRRSSSRGGGLNQAVLDKAAAELLACEVLSEGEEDDDVLPGSRGGGGYGGVGGSAPTASLRLSSSTSSCKPVIDRRGSSGFLRRRGSSSLSASLVEGRGGGGADDAAEKALLKKIVVRKKELRGLLQAEYRRAARTCAERRRRVGAAEEDVQRTLRRVADLGHVVDVSSVSGHKLSLMEGFIALKERALKVDGDLEKARAASDHDAAFLALHAKERAMERTLAAVSTQVMTKQQAAADGGTGGGGKPSGSRKKNGGGEPAGSPADDAAAAAAVDSSTASPRFVTSAHLVTVPGYERIESLISSVAALQRELHTLQKKQAAAQLTRSGLVRGLDDPFFARGAASSRAAAPPATPVPYTFPADPAWEADRAVAWGVRAEEEDEETDNDTDDGTGAARLLPVKANWYLPPDERAAAHDDGAATARAGAPHPWSARFFENLSTEDVCGRLEALCVLVLDRLAAQPRPSTEAPRAGVLSKNVELESWDGSPSSWGDGCSDDGSDDATASEASSAASSSAQVDRTPRLSDARTGTTYTPEEQFNLEHYVEESRRRRRASLASFSSREAEEAVFGPRPQPRAQSMGALTLGPRRASFSEAHHDALPAKFRGLQLQRPQKQRSSRDGRSSSDSTNNNNNNNNCNNNNNNNCNNNNGSGAAEPSPLPRRRASAADADSGAVLLSPIRLSGAVRNLTCAAQLPPASSSAGASPSGEAGSSGAATGARAAPSLPRPPSSVPGSEGCSRSCSPSPSPSPPQQQPQAAAGRMSPRNFFHRIERHPPTRPKSPPRRASTVSPGKWATSVRPPAAAAAQKKPQMHGDTRNLILLPH